MAGEVVGVVVARAEHVHSVVQIDAGRLLQPVLYLQGTCNAFGKLNLVPFSDLHFQINKRAMEWPFRLASDRANGSLVTTDVCIISIHKVFKKKNRSSCTFFYSQNIPRLVTPPPSITNLPSID